jgi:uncharacterized membrane protein
MSANTLPCAACQKPTTARYTTPARALRHDLRALLERRSGALLRDEDELCAKCLTAARTEQILTRLSAERGSLTALESEVALKAATHESVARDLEQTFRGTSTRAQNLADAVARVGGSWTFIGSFGVVLWIWMLVNSLVLKRAAFDPYPYILLNLLLSCLAALQAPIILMSQNRSAARDRLQADQDFRINLKSELEIATLHEKVDHLLHEQWQSMLELQQAQLDLLNEFSERLPPLGEGAPPPSSKPG